LGGSEVKYYCQDCGSYIKQPSEYTGKLIPNTDTKEIAYYIGFIPVKLETGTVVTRMFHVPCVEQFKKENTYEIPEGAKRVVLVD
jgi:hypothetical protein